MCQVVFESRGKVVRFVVVAAIDDHRPIRLVDCLYEALHSDFVPWHSEEPFSAHHWVGVGGGQGEGQHVTPSVSQQLIQGHNTLVCAIFVHTFNYTVCVCNILSQIQHKESQQITYNGCFKLSEN